MCARPRPCALAAYSACRGCWLTAGARCGVGSVVQVHRVDGRHGGLVAAAARQCERPRRGGAAGVGREPVRGTGAEAPAARVRGAKTCELCGGGFAGCPETSESCLRRELGLELAHFVGSRAENLNQIRLLRLCSFLPPKPRCPENGQGRAAHGPLLPSNPPKAGSIPRALTGRRRRPHAARSARNFWRQPPGTGVPAAPAPAPRSAARPTRIEGHLASPSPPMYPHPTRYASSGAVGSPRAGFVRRAAQVLKGSLLRQYITAGRPLHSPRFHDAVHQPARVPQEAVEAQRG